MDPSSNEPRRLIDIHSFGRGVSSRSAVGRALESLASRSLGENEESQRIMLDSLPPGASETFEFISLNEIVQNGRGYLETTRSTERYFNPDYISPQKPQAKITQGVQHVQFGREVDVGTHASDLHEGGRPIRREETFQSTTTTLVGSSRASIADENVERSVPVPTIDVGDSVDEDSDQDGYAVLMSPILGEYI